jgi:hypothetical protein
MVASTLDVFVRTAKIIKYDEVSSSLLQVLLSAIG